MSILKRTAAALMSCAITLSLAACAAPQEETVPKPETYPDTALVIDELGMILD